MTHNKNNFLHSPRKADGQTSKAINSKATFPKLHSSKVPKSRGLQKTPSPSPIIGSSNCLKDKLKIGGCFQEYLMLVNCVSEALSTHQNYSSNLDQDMSDPGSSDDEMSDPNDFDDSMTLDQYQSEVIKEAFIHKVSSVTDASHKKGRVDKDNNPS